MSELRNQLEIAPISVTDARKAVMRWHYSKRMPIGRLVCHGVWELGAFVGVIMYGRGASKELGTQWGCTSLECCELVRIALAPGRKVPTSRALSVSLRMLRKSSPDLKLVVSFADSAQGHVGKLYQSTNWVYAGLTAPAPTYLYKGRWCHLREIASGAFGKGGAVAGFRDLPKRISPPKHRYLYPLHDSVRARVVPQPYPKAPAVIESAGAESIVAMHEAPSLDRAVQSRPRRSTTDAVAGGQSRSASGRSSPRASHRPKRYPDRKRATRAG